VLDQKWDLIVVATEIAKRFYLTIGFATLLMLATLAITSTDGWQKRLRRNWKRLHWLIYPAALVALVHFFIQSKLKIGEPAFAAGLFAWLMLWRVLPIRLQKSLLGLALLAVGATLATVVFEATWYALVNGVDPVRVLMANLDLELAPRPAHKVLIAALLVMLAVALRRLALAANRLWTKRYIRTTIPAP
jgi:methionine sulfoxide reductase heme-binding subunit